MTGAVVWFTGLPASGKSTLAARVQEELGERAVLLDSDELRTALVPAHGYDERGRDQFYDTVARLSALLARQQRVVLVAATANLRAYRARARTLAPAWLEVHVDADVEACARRDFKGLYARARAGEIELPGVTVTYEPPLHADVTARGGTDEEALRAILSAVRDL